ncbi:SDH family Clp fold serine proteinase [Polaromonas sp.]|uniref:SDH family Clp fold serine proteinase n=1 Tax=Polaromonas sp. TaxID=1869339 RepID=UPI002FC7AA8E
MPSWSAIAAEIDDLRKYNAQNAFDSVRRKYLVAARQKTGRAVILYATKWSTPDPNVPPEMLSIHDGDLQGLMEVFHGVQEKELDLIIHSPGGQIDAADAMVSYLRSKFTHIRAIVPNAAMSAAGMIACAADRIVMGKHSFLGPADPQFTLPTTLGGHRQVAVQSIIEQFERAKKECMNDPRALAVWAPILTQYGPDLIVQAERASLLSNTLVDKWLRENMFKADPDGPQKAAKAATWLSSHENFNSHGRHLDRDSLRAQGLVVDSLEDDEEEQDIFLSIFHAATLTMMGTGAAKIIENHLGKAYINQVQTILVQQPPQQAQPAPSRQYLQPPQKNRGPNRRR